MVSLEVCANSITSAIAAQKGGAIRVELCDNLHEGGTTPSYGEILLSRKHLHIKLYVLIRPRGGDFLYTDLEFEIMKADVRHCIDVGCDGIVVGLLNPDGTVDKERCAQLVSMAKSHGLGATFHRAFDVSANLDKTLEDIIEIGFERVLTSGGKSTAMEGASSIKNLIAKAAGRIMIMAGSGILENNVADLVRYTGVKEVHSTARAVLKSRMHYQNDHIMMGKQFNNEYEILVTNPERVQKIISEANR